MSDEPIKVFRLNDYEWWAARSLEEARSDYTETTGLSGEDAFDHPTQLSDEEMDQFIFIGDDGTKVSFRQHLSNSIARGNQFPGPFATTEY